MILSFGPWHSITVSRQPWNFYDQRTNDKAPTIFSCLPFLWMHKILSLDPLPKLPNPGLSCTWKMKTCPGCQSATGCWLSTSVWDTFMRRTLKSGLLRVLSPWKFKLKNRMNFTMSTNCWPVTFWTKLCPLRAQFWVTVFLSGSQWTPDAGKVEEKMIKT